MEWFNSLIQQLVALAKNILNIFNLFKIRKIESAKEQEKIDIKKEQAETAKDIKNKEIDKLNETIGWKE